MADGASNDTDRAKRQAASRAAELVESGMKIGLGSGSTAEIFLEEFAKRVKGGLHVAGVPTSLRTGKLAERLGVPLTTLDAVGWLDLTIDGADEIDPELNLIKGGGGALLVEKIVANASDRMVVIADASKNVAQLGAFPLPVEITPFAWQTTRAVIEQILAGFDVDATKTALRLTRDEPFITDEGNMIIDLHLERIGDPGDLAYALNAIPGVVENGLFIGVADAAVVADNAGQVSVLMREQSGG